LEVTLLEMETNYDNPSESSFTFSNRLRINNANFIYADLFGQAVGSGVAIGKDAATSSTVGGWTVGTGGIGVPGAILSNIGYISFGNNPPTYYGNNVGAWLGFSGVAKISLYSNENNYLQWDGTKLLVKAQNFTLDANGNITATNATLSGTITATLGSIAGWTISSSQLYKTGAFINSSTPAIGLGTTTDYLTGTGFWVGQNSGIYKMHIGNPAGDNMRWDGSNLSATGYLQSTDSAVEFELMKMSFTNISWSQFAVFDALNDETKRLSPETSTYPAIVHFGGIDNGGDTTGDRIFGFNSKVYTNITTVYTGTSSAVGSGFLEDQYATWFDNQYTGFELVDSASTVFDIIGCTTDPFGTSWNILVVGTPTAGAYYIQSKIPTTAVAFCEFSDSTNGGTGTVILDVSFDGGVHYQAFLDTGSSVNLLGGSVLIANTGRDVCFKASVINDAGGDGAIIYKLLVAFDPSPWL